MDLVTTSLVGEGGGNGSGSVRPTAWCCSSCASGSSCGTVSNAFRVRRCTSHGCRRRARRRTSRGRRGRQDPSRRHQADAGPVVRRAHRARPGLARARSARRSTRRSATSVGHQVNGVFSWPDTLTLRELPRRLESRATCGSHFLNDGVHRVAGGGADAAAGELRRLRCQPVHSWRFNIFFLMLFTAGNLMPPR